MAYLNPDRASPRDNRQQRALAVKGGPFLLEGVATSFWHILDWQFS